MANIYIDVNELPLRMHDIAGWLRRGDAVFVTDSLKPAFQLVPADANTTVPRPPTEGIKPRVLGLHAGAAVVSSDFNDPLPDEFWSGESK
jgi:antitoxin (DNA-binding transcriptional repressor) of toxin-antitoxin stability system